MRFLGLGLQDRTPDATTVWQYRERLIVEELFDRFDSFLRARGYEAKGGQIVDASIVEVPRQRNRKEEDIHRGANFALMLAVCTILSENTALAQRTMHALQKTV